MEKLILTHNCQQIW